MPNIEAHIAIISGALAPRRLRHGNEKELQDGIDAALVAVGCMFQREIHLSPTDRIDFIIGAAPPGLGVEVKIKGSLADLLRQLHRYAQHEELGGLLVVTSLLRLTDLPRELVGKPVRSLYIGGGL